VQPGLTLNGKLTLGENIADLGGIKAAHAAYRQWAQTIREPQAIDGLTNEQLFFVSFAQIWCSEETAEAERVLVLTDPHSRPEFRVNGPLANFQAFARAFSCEPGTPMRPHNTCEVW
jgi:predicted metalloendopeptidase